MTNWVRYGHAAKLAAHGYRIVMPDLRAHGDSAKPHIAAAYPIDVLADDGLALIEHLGLSDYDLGGYSLGGRTVVRMLVVVPCRPVPLLREWGWKGSCMPIATLSSSAAS